MPAFLTGDMRQVPRFSGTLRDTLRYVQLVSVAILAPYSGERLLQVFTVVERSELPPDPTLALVGTLICPVLFFEYVVATVVRAKRMGSPFVIRLVRIFTLSVLVPTAFLAAIALATVLTETRNWITEDILLGYQSAIDAGRDYDENNRRALRSATIQLTLRLNSELKAVQSREPGVLRAVLFAEFEQIRGGLDHTYIIDGSPEFVARGWNSYLFDVELPKREIVDLVRQWNTPTGQSIPWESSCRDDAPSQFCVEREQFADVYGAVYQAVKFPYPYAAVVPLQALPDLYLFSVINALPSIFEMKTVLAEQGGGNQSVTEVLLEIFGQLFSKITAAFIGFAVAVLVLAAFIGYMVSRRLSRPLAEISGVATRIASEQISLENARLRIEGDNEVRSLAAAFQKMTRNLARERQRLEESNAELAGKERTLAGVLGNVNSGVVGLDAGQRIIYANHAARGFLLGGSLEEPLERGRPFRESLPELAELADRLERRDTVSDDLPFTVTRNGEKAEIRASMARIRDEMGNTEGFVLAFDDVTRLVKLQQESGWREAAQRFAHDLGNPLTPIALAADGISAGLSDELTPQRIAAIRQRCDSISSEIMSAKERIASFREFADHPVPDPRMVALSALIRGEVELESLRDPETVITMQLPEKEIYLRLDPTMIKSVIMNLIKNAHESVRTKKASLARSSPERHGFVARVAISVERKEDRAIVIVEDNGVGLEQKPKAEALPRASGRGYGLSSIRHNVEAHGGTFTLSPAKPFEGCRHQGARARIVLPILGGAIERIDQARTITDGSEDSFLSAEDFAEFV